jgi:hypothetical protein
VLQILFNNYSTQQDAKSKDSVLSIIVIKGGGHKLILSIRPYMLYRSKFSMKN